MIIAYADASLKDNLLGIGYVLERLTESGEKKLVEASHTLLNTNEVSEEVDIMEAEYRACITAARRATDYETEGLLLYNDNKGVIERIQNGETVGYNDYYYHALFSFLGRFDNWQVSWLQRDNNDLAHKEARMAMKIGEYYGFDGGATA